MLHHHCGSCCEVQIANCQCSCTHVSLDLQSVAVVQRAIRKRDPAEEMEEMGFGSLTLVSSFPVSMSGAMQLTSESHLYNSDVVLTERHVWRQMIYARKDELRFGCR